MQPKLTWFSNKN